jgi:hypothetical protein
VQTGVKFTDYSGEAAALINQGGFIVDKSVASQKLV